MKGILIFAVLFSSSLHALEGNLIENKRLRYLSSTEEAICGKANCEKCFNIEPTLDKPCSDQFGEFNFTNVRNTLGLPNFKNSCINHDACYQILAKKSLVVIDSFLMICHLNVATNT